MYYRPQGGGATENDVNDSVIPMARVAASKQRKREAPKGRTVSPAALIEVQALVGNEPLAS